MDDNLYSKTFVSSNPLQINLMTNIISKASELILHNNESDIDSDVQNLIHKAKESALKAYAVYSNFLVGAALLLKDGTVVTGNNQENACYPTGLCAERVAFFSAKSQYPDSIISKVAIVAKRREDDHFKPVMPCGSCRQVMAEYESNQNKPIKLYVAGKNGEVYESNSIENLLPFKFSSADLMKP